MRDEPGDRNRLVPPYAITGGRARPTLLAHEMELETIVATTNPYAAPPPGLTPEQRAILAQCGTMLSVAEVAALLDVPVALARVLIGDLAVWGLVTLHRPSGGADLALLGRVLDGLRVV